MFLRKYLTRPRDSHFMCSNWRSQSLVHNVSKLQKETKINKILRGFGILQCGDRQANTLEKVPFNSIKRFKMFYKVKKMCSVFDHLYGVGRWVFSSMGLYHPLLLSNVWYQYVGYCDSGWCRHMQKTCFETGGTKASWSAQIGDRDGTVAKPWKNYSLAWKS